MPRKARPWRSRRRAKQRDGHARRASVPGVAGVPVACRWRGCRSSPAATQVGTDGRRGIPSEASVGGPKKESGADPRTPTLIVLAVSALPSLVSSTRENPLQPGSRSLQPCAARVGGPILRSNFTVSTIWSPSSHLSLGSHLLCEASHTLHVPCINGHSGTGRRDRRGRPKLLRALLLTAVWVVKLSVLVGVRPGG
jgi:hypothetical protein